MVLVTPDCASSSWPWLAPALARASSSTSAQGTPGLVRFAASLRANPFLTFEFLARPWFDSSERAQGIPGSLCTLEWASQPIQIREDKPNVDESHCRHPVPCTRFPEDPRLGKSPDLISFLEVEIISVNPSRSSARREL